MNKIICHYCGRVKEEVSFYIGYCPEPDWVMVEGTGWIACPDCCDKAIKEGQERINGTTKKTK